MTDKIDQYLDGTMERAGLGPAERAEADDVQEVIRQARALFDARPSPDLSPRVMRQLDRGAPPATEPLRNFARHVLRELWTAREVSLPFRHAYGLIAAAVFILVVVSWPDALQRPFMRWPNTSATPEPTLFVRFQLQASDVSDVRLAGSFTRWEPKYEMHQTAPGTWEITVPLSPGVHDYAFIVDGSHWMADPHAPAVADGFGGTNSRISIIPPRDSRL